MSQEEIDDIEYPVPKIRYYYHPCGSIEGFSDFEDGGLNSEIREDLKN